MSGSCLIKQKLSIPLDASFDSNRCTLDMKHCEKFNSLNVKGVCKRFTNSSSILGKMTAIITPPLSCPVQPGNYSTTKFDIDTKTISFLPLDGYIYNIQAKLASVNPATKKKTLVGCIKFEAKIVKIRVGS